jgi:zinc transport system substrate-binding protein
MIRDLTILTALIALLAGCEQTPLSAEKAGQRLPENPAEKPLVVASFYPLYDFTRQVVGDRAEVVSLVPPGVEPHDWEPAPRDVARIERAVLFVYNGAGLDPWAERLIGNLAGSGPALVRATDGLALLTVDLPGHGHDHKKDGEAKTAKQWVQNVEYDPHVWLDPVLAQAQVEAIRAGLLKADQSGAAAYEASARTFTARLAALHESFEKGLAECARREIVVSHAAFTYLARRYRLSQVPIMGLSPDAEPTPAELAKIVRFTRRHQVKYIFFETLVSGKLADTLARETGARTLVLNPIEGITSEEAAAGKDYLSLMQDNLASLRTALECR